MDWGGAQVAWWAAGGVQKGMWFLQRAAAGVGVCLGGGGGGLSVLLCLSVCLFVRELESPFVRLIGHPIG